MTNLLEKYISSARTADGETTAPLTEDFMFVNDTKLTPEELKAIKSNATAKRIKAVWEATFKTPCPWFYLWAKGGLPNNPTGGAIGIVTENGAPFPPRMTPFVVFESVLRNGRRAPEVILGNPFKAPISLPRDAEALRLWMRYANAIDEITSIDWTKLWKQTK